MKIDVKGGESDILLGMKALLDHRMIDYIVMEVVRSNAAQHWSSLLKHLDVFVNDHGASLYKLDRRGSALRINLEEVVVQESFYQLVVDFI